MKQHSMLISPIFASAMEKIKTNMIIGIISPVDSAWKGFLGINPRKIPARFDCCSAIVLETYPCISCATSGLIKL